ncbi:MAG: hypothetical protein M1274_06010 [Actinobacteria bacterium]|nr:hypothetical protein [Actinomycetota bacterium]
MALGQYEQIVKEALEMMSNGPWNATHLMRVKDVINDEMCGGYGAECRSSEVIDWLNALDPQEQEDLLFRLNEEAHEW